jgi:hypothetical protein
LEFPWDLGLGIWDLPPASRGFLPVSGDLRPMRNRLLFLILGISLGFGIWDWKARPLLHPRYGGFASAEARELTLILSAIISKNS